MQTKTVDVHEAQTHLVELLSLVSAGTEIILMAGNTPLARIVPMAGALTPRVAGLHPSQPPSFPQPAVPRPSHREPSESSASRILSRLSRLRIAAPCRALRRRAAAACWERRPRRARAAAAGGGGRRQRRGENAVSFSYPS